MDGGSRSSGGPTRPGALDGHHGWGQALRDPAAIEETRSALQQQLEDAQRIQQSDEAHLQAAQEHSQQLGFVVSSLRRQLDAQTRDAVAPPGVRTPGQASSQRTVKSSSMHISRQVAVVAGLVVALMPLSAPAAGAVDDPVGVAATFNDPVGTAAQQDAIRNQLISLIDRSPAGAEINGSVYLITDGGVRDALVSAKQRGVKVKLIVDGDAVPDSDPDNGKATGSEYSALAAASGLGTDLTADSWVMACPADRGCVGNRNLGGGDDGAINHNKFFLFSKVGSTENVVFQTSANLTSSQRRNLYNNAVTLPDNGSGLYAAYRSYWQDLRTHGSSGAGLADYDRTHNTGPYTTHFFPRREKTGTTYSTDPSTDTVVSLLNDVECAGGSSRIRIGMYAFTRPQVADKLVQLQAAGCQVELLHNGEDGNLGTTVQKTIAGKLGYIARCSGTVTGSDGTSRTIGIHSKYLLVEGTYRGVPNRKLVFTGSHNYTFPNLRSHDETLLTIDDPAVHDAFRSNFEAIKASPHCTSWPQTPATPGGKTSSLVQAGTSLYHGIHLADGSWTGFTDVQSKAGHISGIRTAAAAGINADTHVVALGGDGRIHHTIRTADGTWAKFGDVGAVAGTLGNVSQVSAVSIGNDLHVVAVAGGKAFHTIRNATGHWTSFGDISGAVGPIGTVTTAATASVGGELHLIVVSSGKAFHTIRNTAGQWTAWGSVASAAGTTGPITSVSMAGIGDDAQIVIATDNGTRQYHTIRKADRTWSPFGDLKDHLGTVTVTSLGAAHVDGELQLTATTSDNKLIHIIRHADRTWTPATTVTLQGVTGTLGTTAITGTL
ncbi:phospholipase D-like domain-containing protein [Streptomyces sp. NRRL S-118]|uniref:phospholipase D-like domain-containing protein n=1 Tax=Streptomyces sp. NRRL S-118 TaxID=1463881 RepID=UPI000D147632|nr:phospholipase D-like domain-containing protein [Streptomyces sp. NRRL S-118]